MLDTLGDTKISRPVASVAYYAGEAGITRQSGERSRPCSGNVLPHLEMRKGRLRALMPAEQNFGEWMEFRHERSCLSWKRKIKWGKKHRGRLKLGIESLRNLKLSD